MSDSDVVTADDVEDLLADLAEKVAELNDHVQGTDDASNERVARLREHVDRFAESLRDADGERSE